MRSRHSWGFTLLEVISPQAYILSSGEMTPFTLTLQSALSDARYYMTVSLLGELKWELEDAL